MYIKNEKIIENSLCKLAIKIMKSKKLRGVLGVSQHCRNEFDNATLMQVRKGPPDNSNLSMHYMRDAQSLHVT